MATGFSFGATSTPAATGGFNFGATPAATGTTTGIALGQPQAASGFTLGVTPAKTTAQGFTLGVPTQTPAAGFAATSAAPSTLGSSGGFSFGTPGAAAGATTAPVAPTAAVGGFSFGLGTATTSAATTQPPGFSLTVPTTQPPGFSLTVPTTQPPGFSLTVPTTAAAGASGGLGGFNFGKPPTLAPTLGGLTAPTAPTTGLSLFGATPSAASTTTASIFSTATATAATVGLGGVDPKTSTAPGGTVGTAGKTSDGKAVKETQMPALLVENVTVFQKYVKDEKIVREDIARMSTKPMLKVQEDTAALKQLLSVVSNGLQRNACAVDKLKKEMAIELKNAEMAQRTKDIPPGLQYENTAPTIYFQQLVEEFEARMITYRQQIETLETHLAALHQPTRHTPAELIALMKKLHETFIALAAQLHQVNEAVKLQKEHFLNYRKIFHGDVKNIFEKQQKLPVNIAPTRTIDPAGPTPFPGMTNAAAAAMASVLNKSQQPAGAPPVIGLTTGTLGGAASGLSTMGGSSLFGGGGLASSSGLSGSAPQLSGLSSLLSMAATQPSTATVKPLGVLSSSIFSSPSAPINPTTTIGYSFSTSTPQTAGVPGLLGATPGQSTLSAGTNKPFQLQKPPQGAKRGKR